MPAIAGVHDIGHGEVSIHVAVNPTKDAESAITAADAATFSGFRSGPASADIILEVPHLVGAEDWHHVPGRRLHHRIGQPAPHQRKRFFTSGLGDGCQLDLDSV